MVREAGWVVGEVTADVESVLNPALVVVGGSLSEPRNIFSPALGNSFFSDS